MLHIYIYIHMHAQLLYIYIDSAHCTVGLGVQTTQLSALYRVLYVLYTCVKYIYMYVHSTTTKQQQHTCIGDGYAGGKKVYYFNGTCIETRCPNASFTTI